MKGKPIENKMLLLFGMPRSGTTWVGKIFDSHPDVLYLHEPDTETNIKSVPRLVTSDSYSQYKELIYQYSSSFLDRCVIRINGKTPFFNKSYISSHKYAFFKLNLIIAKILGKINFFIPIWNPFKSNTVNDFLVIWKSIESCGRIGLIIDALPAECKAIYVVRHPCGQIASVINGEKSGRFSSKVSNAEDYCLFESLLHSNYAIQNNLTIEKIKAMKPVERLAIRWVLYNEQALEDIENSGKKAMIIRYEDICIDTIEETKKLFEFANLNWGSQTKKFIEKSTLGNSAGYYSVYKDPKIAMSKWKSSLTNDEIIMIKNTVSKSKAGALFAENF